MTPRREFHPLQATEIAGAFQAEGVDYLFIGKSGAILLGFPGTTQDVDIFAAHTPENGERIVRALRSLAFEIDERLACEIRRGKDFVQVKTGPFDVDLIFAPDGIESFEKAKSRSVTVGVFKVAHIRDIIASKRASNRQRDLVDLPLLEVFRDEFEKARGEPLRTAAEIAAERAKEEGPR